MKDYAAIALGVFLGGVALYIAYWAGILCLDVWEALTNDDYAPPK